MKILTEEELKHHFTVASDLSRQVVIQSYMELAQFLCLASKELNRLAMMQMGSLDYTQDFFEECKQTLRPLLKDWPK